MTRCRDGARLALLACALILATGCVPARVLVKPRTVEVPTFTRAPIPATLTSPVIVTWPDGACWNGTERVLCNGQLASLLLDYSEAIDRCNADRKALTGH